LKNYPINRENWEQGLRVEVFSQGLTTHKESILRRLSQVNLTVEQRALFTNLKTPRYMVIMTEEWCSDCLMNLPILVKIAEAAPEMEVRIFIRRDWPELRAYYTSQDIPSIPVATLLDRNFQPVGSWIERPYAAHERLTAWKAAHPEVEQTRKRADLSSEEKRELLREVLDQLLVEMEGWYNESLQAETVREVAEILRLLELKPDYKN
jgi:hypothetical protein